MAYDPVAESIALIERGLPEAPPRLSRRRRWAALAVDVDGDIAGTLFTVRGPGHVRHERHLLARVRGAWTVLGGGSGGGDVDGGLADRPSTAELGAPAVVVGRGSVVRGSDRRVPRGAGYVSDAELLVSSDVHSVVVAGSRVLTVPRHGRLVVVWSGRQPPAVVARDAAAHPLGEVRLASPGARRLPEWYPDAPGD